MRRPGIGRPDLTESYMAQRIEEADQKRNEELNRSLGICEECGKAGLKHHATCSRYKGTR